MREDIELIAFIGVAFFNGGVFLWWLRLLLWSVDRPRALYPVTATALALFITSLAVCVSQAVFVFDRPHVMEVGRWLRPIVDGGLFIAGATTFFWWRSR